MSDVRPTNTPSHVYLDLLIRRVAELCGVTPYEMCGRLRGANVVLAREVYTACARRHTRCSYPQIAAALGKSPRGHATFIEAHARYNRRIESGRIVARVTTPSGACDLDADGFVDYIVASIERGASACRAT